MFDLPDALAFIALLALLFFGPCDYGPKGRESYRAQVVDKCNDAFVHGSPTAGDDTERCIKAAMVGIEAGQEGE